MSFLFLSLKVTSESIFAKQPVCLGRHLATETIMKVPTTSLLPTLFISPGLCWWSVPNTVLDVACQPRPWALPSGTLQAKRDAKKKADSWWPGPLPTGILAVSCLLTPLACTGTRALTLRLSAVAHFSDFSVLPSATHNSLFCSRNRPGLLLPQSLCTECFSPGQRFVVIHSVRMASPLGVYPLTAHIHSQALCLMF